MAGRVFVPRAGCTVASGDCGVQGRCLGGCRSREPASEAKELERLIALADLAISELRKIHRLLDEAIARCQAVAPKREGDGNG